MSCPGCPRRFVGHGGNPDASLVCIGTAPGLKDRPGEPFSGYASRDFDAVILPHSGVSRSEIMMANVVGCFWEDQSDIPAATIAECSHKHLPPLLRDAEVVVVMGAKACSALGINARDDHGFARWMEIPQWRYEGVVVPTLHPAEVLHDPSVIGSLVKDFKAVRAALNGELIGPPVAAPWTANIITDYREFAPLEPGEPVSIDTEWDTETGDPISLQYSTDGVTGHLIRASDMPSLFAFDVGLQKARPIILHNQDEDLSMSAKMGVTVPEARVLDTMAMCFHHGLPQGLKEVSWRELGGEWLTYDELVMPYFQMRLNEYIEEAMAKVSLIKIPYRKATVPPDVPIPEEDPNYKPVRTMKTKPHPLLKKLEKMYQTDIGGWKGKVYKWKDREELEKLCGPLPEPSLRLVPDAQFVDYACADAVFTFRLYELLRKRRFEMKF